MKNKEKDFDTNPDINRVTLDYDCSHVISFFQAEKLRFTNQVTKLFKLGL